MIYWPSVTLSLFIKPDDAFSFAFDFALVLAGVFLGLGTERASTDWDDVFALPHPVDFLFWRWHSLERKRYTAVLITLMISVSLVWIIGWARS